MVVAKVDGLYQLTSSCTLSMSAFSACLQRRLGGLGNGSGVYSSQIKVWSQRVNGKWLLKRYCCSF